MTKIGLACRKAFGSGVRVGYARGVARCGAKKTRTAKSGRRYFYRRKKSSANKLKTYGYTLVRDL